MVKLLIAASTDHIELGNLAYEWARSYDLKDWERLRQILAPSVRLDFRSLQGELHENLSPEEYVAILIKMIGDKRMMTQHLLGGSKWEHVSGDSVEVTHQLRVAHQRYSDESLSAVINQGHGYGYAKHSYKKIDGVWKLEGVAPELAWTEFDLFGTLNPEAASQKSE